jgi:outer membrane receptor for Fe3+-dicitrate
VTAVASASSDGVRRRDQRRGRFIISAPSGEVRLLFRRIGFKRKQVPVAAEQATADVTMDQDVFNLEAIVVSGQQTGIERRNAAVSTTVVRGAEVSSVPAPALDRALQGRVPGAYIQQNSGAPGGGTQIQIRGSNTVVGAADPLYVVDGSSQQPRCPRLFAITAAAVAVHPNDGESR